MKITHLHVFAMLLLLLFAYTLGAYRFSIYVEPIHEAKITALKEDKKTLRQALSFYGIEASSTATPEEILAEAKLVTVTSTTLYETSVADFVNVCDDINLLKSAGAIK